MDGRLLIGEKLPEPLIANPIKELLVFGKAKSIFGSWAFFAHRIGLIIGGFQPRLIAKHQTVQEGIVNPNLL